MPLRRSLVFRLAATFLGFVVLGSIGLVAWLDYQETHESQSAFAATARSNARFIRSQRLPQSARTAEALGEVLGMETYFLRGAEIAAAIPDPNARLLTREGAALEDAARLDPGEVRSRSGGEGIRVLLDDGWSLVLFRMRPAAGEFWRAQTFVGLGAFWLLSLGLAWAFAGGIVGPLRKLAQRLPRIAEEGAEPEFPEASRRDEIGQLARAYLETRTALTGERRARQQAERLATLGKMATGLAHEINNPVTAIKLHAQLLEGGVGEAPDDSLGIIIAEAAKIEGLVSQWMFLARPQPPQTSRCDLAEIIAASVRTQKKSAEHCDVRIVNETAPGLWVNCDARRMSQAVGNLVINAIHAMAAQGGTLTIRARESSDASTFREITFTDTGPGFSEAALARHAELFFSEKEGGMGIGLSVTSEILRAHGGELRVANSPSGGAVATFVLPLAGDPKSEAERSETEPHSGALSQGSIRNPKS